MEIEFSIIHDTDDLLLYILTKNPLKPFIVYKYNGINGFVEFVVGSTIPHGNNLTLMKNFNQEFIAITINNNELLILEAIIN